MSFLLFFHLVGYCNQWTQGNQTLHLTLPCWRFASISMPRMRILYLDFIVRVFIFHHSIDERSHSVGMTTYSINSLPLHSCTFRIGSLWSLWSSSAKTIACMIFQVTNKEQKSYSESVLSQLGLWGEYEFGGWTAYMLYMIAIESWGARHI